MFSSSLTSLPKANPPNQLLGLCGWITPSYSIPLGPSGYLHPFTSDPLSSSSQAVDNFGYMLLVLSSEDCCRSFSNPRIERYELTATAVPGEICLVTAAGEPVTWQCVSCSLSKTCPKSFETKAYNGRAVNLICSHFWMDTVQIATIRWQTAIKKLSLWSWLVPCHACCL